MITRNHLCLSHAFLRDTTSENYNEDPFHKLDQKETHFYVIYCCSLKNTTTLGFEYAAPIDELSLVKTICS